MGILKAVSQLDSNLRSLPYYRCSPFSVLPVVPTDDCVAPIAFTVPLQLLSYHVAVLKGTDVDQPRNLAKSVSVEKFSAPSMIAMNKAFTYSVCK